MSKVSAFIHLSLDGVMQSPARPDEDARGGFAHGGWQLPYADPVLGNFVAENMRQAAVRRSALLFGRRTYEDFYSVWPNGTDNPFTEVLNNTHKYVASTTLSEPLVWQNSTLLRGDAAEAVARLKEQSDENLVVLGSGQLMQSLMCRGLVDEFVLTIQPLVLGSGRRLFADWLNRFALELVESKTTTTGVIIAVYRLAQPVARSGYNEAQA
jgi:dihydrofolate reductase